MGFELVQLEPFLQITLAAFLGATLGLEREYRRREAGLRTFALVSLGACFLTVASIYLSSDNTLFPFVVQADPVRVIQAVAVGIGFIGSGVIIYHKFQVEGLTTAAALWAAGAIGIGVGLKMYFLTVFATLLTIIILAGLRSIEERYFPESKEN